MVTARALSASKPESDRCPPCSHRLHNDCEGDELLLLGAQERIRFEEWDDLLKQIDSPPDHEDQRGVA